MSAWAHLPNAHHIDWVLASVKAHPDQWVAARVSAWVAVWDAARDAARDAVYALTAWDDCDYLFALPEHAVRWLASEGDHAAVLLLSMYIVKQQESLSLTS